MDVERVINEIEQVEEMWEAADIRPLSTRDISAANRRHDEMLADSPWFRLWQAMASVAELRLRYSDCRNKELTSAGIPISRFYIEFEGGNSGAVQRWDGIYSLPGRGTKSFWHCGKWTRSKSTRLSSSAESS